MCVRNGKDLFVGSVISERKNVVRLRKLQGPESCRPCKGARIYSHCREFPFECFQSWIDIMLFRF